MIESHGFEAAGLMPYQCCRRTVFRYHFSGGHIFLLISFCITEFLASTFEVEANKSFSAEKGQNKTQVLPF